MHNNLAYVALTTGGVPVSLSCGVPVLDLKGRAPGAGVSVRSPYSGGVELEIDGLGIGPGCPGWSYRQRIPPILGADRTLDRLSGDMSTDFGSLESTAAFWVADSRGQFIMRDLKTRRNILVSPLDPSLGGVFWSGIAAAMSGDEDQDLEETWSSLQPLWDRNGLYDRGVWACLRPCPHTPDRPTVWTFKGHQHVRFDFSLMRPRESEVAAEEGLYGTAAYFV